MNQTLLSEFGTPEQRVERAIAALREGRGVMVLDDENRENEGDMIFAAETMTVEQMALTIRHGSGIVCLCLTEARRQQLVNHRNDGVAIFDRKLAARHKSRLHVDNAENVRSLIDRDHAHHPRSITRAIIRALTSPLEMGSCPGSGTMRRQRTASTPEPAPCTHSVRAG